MRTYSSGSGRFHDPGPAHPPISPPPMKSVTNVNALPFQVKRYGHDDGLRSSSVTVKLLPSRDAGADVSAWRMPDGHNTRTTSAVVRGPRPKAVYDGAIAGEADETSRTWRRLPALISTF